MNEEIFNHLCVLSKLKYSDSEKVRAIKDMSSIINLMDKIKNIDMIYDDTKDGNEISFSDLREDIPGKSFETEKLLSNTQSRNNCYVVPKMIEIE